jgi:hypothetical protein
MKTEAGNIHKEFCFSVPSVATNILARKRRRPCIITQLSYQIFEFF